MAKTFAIAQIPPNGKSVHFHYVPIDGKGFAYLCGNRVADFYTIQKDNTFLKWPSTYRGAILHLPEGAQLIVDYEGLDHAQP